MRRYTLFLHYPELTEEDVGDEGWEEGKREALITSGTAFVLAGTRLTTPPARLGADARAGRVPPVTAGAELRGAGRAG